MKNIYCYDCGVKVTKKNNSPDDSPNIPGLKQCKKCYFEEINNTPEFQRKLKATEEFLKRLG